MDLGPPRPAGVICGFSWEVVGRPCRRYRAHASRSTAKLEALRSNPLWRDLRLVRARANCFSMASTLRCPEPQWVLVMMWQTRWGRQSSGSRWQALRRRSSIS